MKSKFLIVFLIFIITVSTAQGLKFPLRKKCPQKKTLTCGNPVVVNGNTTYIYIEGRPIKRRILGPTVIRKNTRCLCKLPSCECNKSDNPETWYVKTFLRGNTRMTPAEYIVNHCNITAEVYNCLEELQKLKSTLRAKQEAETGLKSKLCPMKKKTQCGNKFLFGCPPLINLSKNKKCLQTHSPQTNLNIQTDCLECKLQQSEDDKTKVLLKCRHCGPVITGIGGRSRGIGTGFLQKINRRS